MSGLRLCILCLGVVACGLGPQASRPEADAPPAQVAAPHALGPLHIGMARSELQSLGLPVTSTTEEAEGDIYYLDAITLSNGVRVVAASSEGVVLELSTDTIGYATADGARVGDTLEMLRRTYPDGELSKGIGENGRYFIFMTGRQIESFEFDASGLSSECLVEAGYDNCPRDIATRRSIAFNVR